MLSEKAPRRYWSMLIIIQQILQTRLIDKIMTTIIDTHMNQTRLIENLIHLKITINLTPSSDTVRIHDTIIILQRHIHNLTDKKTAIIKCRSDSLDHYGSHHPHHLEFHHQSSSQNVATVHNTIIPSHQHKDIPEYKWQ